MRREFRVGEEEEGIRLDRLVSSRIGISRSAAAGLIEAGSVKVDALVAKKSDKPAVDSLVSVEDFEDASDGVVPEKIPIEVRYEDSELAVVSKPAGLPTHPAPGRKTGTLANALVAIWPQISEVGQAGRPGIVHRLDTDTSGLLLVAKTPRAYDALVEMIRTRAVERVYRALVVGCPSLPTGTVDAPIGRDPRSRSRMAIVASGRPARTHYEMLECYKGRAALLEVSLETGRTHQIRVHLSSIGHPVAGDQTYRGRGTHLSRELARLERTFLHSYRIGFDHPFSGERIELIEPLPEDLAYVESELMRSS